MLTEIGAGGHPGDTGVLRATGEIGRVRVGKIEKMGRHNRRVNVLFDE